MESLSDAERIARERFLVFAYPKAKEGDRYPLNDGLWIVHGNRWTPYAEYAALKDAEKELAKHAATTLNMERVLADGRRQEVIQSKTPSWDDLKRELPGIDVIEHEDGSFTADYRDTSDDGRYKKKIDGMFGEVREIEVERSAELSARLDWEDIGTAYHPKLVPLQHADATGRKMAEQR